MKKEYAKFILLAALIAGPFALGPGSIGARQNGDGASASLAGTWTMALQHDHVVPVALVLKQDAKKVTGKMIMPAMHGGERKEVLLEGEFVDGTLEMSTGAEGDSGAAQLKLEATLKDDGTLVGTLSSPKGTLKWTAERLRQRD